jgi:hypothetical protein
VAALFRNTETTTMPATTRSKSGPAPTRKVVSTAYDAAAVLAQSSLSQLGTLFDAIKAFSERPLAVQDLASIGNYLADDWADLLEAQCEECKKAIEDLS